MDNLSYLSCMNTTKYAVYENVTWKTTGNISDVSENFVNGRKKVYNFQYKKKTVSRNVVKMC